MTDIQLILDKLLNRKLSLDEAEKALLRLQERAIQSADNLSSAEGDAYDDGFRDGTDYGYDQGFDAGCATNDY